MVLASACDQSRGVARLGRGVHGLSAALLHTRLKGGLDAASERLQGSARGALARTTIKGFDDEPDNPANALRDVVVVQNEYDDADRLIRAFDPLARATRTDWFPTGLPRSRTLENFQPPTGPARPLVLEEVDYDPAGHVIQARHGTGATIVGSRYDAAGRLYETVLDPTSWPATGIFPAVNNPAGLNRVTSLTLDKNGNPTIKTTVGPDPIAGGTRTETVKYRYDNADRVVCEAVDNGPSADTDDLNTWFTRDARGNALTVTDPRGIGISCLTGTVTPTGFTTTSTYDVAGRLQKTVAPAVPLNGTTTTVNPTVAVGYNAFGDKTHERDPNGFLTRRGFDKNSRLVLVKHPRYTQPHTGGLVLDPAEMFTYDFVGNLLTQTDPRGQLTTHAFDKRNRVYKKTDPTLASAGATAGGVTRTTYDDTGNITVVTDPLGAVASSTFDMANRVRSNTMTVRATTSGTRASTATSWFSYDDLGNLVSETSPNGNVTLYGYNPASEQTTITDPAGKITSMVRDLAGRQVRITDPLGRVTDSLFDVAGRNTQTLNKGAGGTQTPLITSVTYDKASNVVTSTTPRGTVGGSTYRTTYTYDALSRTTKITEPTDGTVGGEINTHMVMTRKATAPPSATAAPPLRRATRI